MLEAFMLPFKGNDTERLDALFTVTRGGAVR
jgi:hypothetical protein